MTSIGTCGASFTMISYEEDSLMAQYDIPPEVDTVNVCETWTGSDYVMRADIVGSSEYGQVEPDSEHSVTYQSGAVTGFAADGGEYVAQTDNGPTAFDFMHADSATRQASYDSPYYGVYSPHDPSTCVPIAGQTCALSAVKTDGLYTKHGLTRRGVRALVDGLQEVGKSKNGARRFRKVRGDEETTLDIDAVTQLLVGEEVRTAKRTQKATHAWKRDESGYVRTRTEMEDVEEVNGKKFRSLAIITFTDVRVP